MVNEFKHSGAVKKADEDGIIIIKGKEKVIENIHDGMCCPIGHLKGFMEVIL